jgi:hypothetical protein
MPDCGCHSPKKETSTKDWEKRYFESVWKPLHGLRLDALDTRGSATEFGEKVQSLEERTHDFIRGEIARAEEETGPACQKHPYQILIHCLSCNHEKMEQAKQDKTAEILALIEGIRLETGKMHRNGAHIIDIDDHNLALDSLLHAIRKL